MKVGKEHYKEHLVIGSLQMTLQETTSMWKLAKDFTRNA